MSAALVSTPTVVPAGRLCLEGTSASSQSAEIRAAMASAPDPTCVPAPTVSSPPAVVQE